MTYQPKGSTPQPSTEMLSFKILKSGQAGHGPGKAPRLGRLLHPQRAPMETPNYIAISSRGAVPHISQDMMRQRTRIAGIHVALEDFIERAPRDIPPVYSLSTPGESPLRRFIALQRDAFLVMSPRRIPAVPTPSHNTHNAISILTSFGFAQLKLDDYVNAALKLRPDIVVGLADVGSQAKSSTARIEKMGDRTAAWTETMSTALSQHVDKGEVGDESHGIRAAVFAPILPLPIRQQSIYVDELASDRIQDISGLALYSADIAPSLPAALDHLPKLSLSEPESPHQLLDQIALGLDIFTIPFITAATDAGIALDFSFPAPSKGLEDPQSLEDSRKSQLGLDMWLESHATDTGPLKVGCRCYACTSHHRAYVRHLLNANEMLGWVLLQLHNLHVMDEFFAGVRHSISKETFEADLVSFGNVYSPSLPEQTGRGPRVRGYQFKSNGSGDAKKNAVAYRELNDVKEKLAEAAPLIALAGEAEVKEFAETTG